MSDMTRTAGCACGRVRVTVQNEPLAVATCHCDFCQKRTGSVFQVGAYYARDEQIDVSGETKVYNGLEIDGVGNASGDSVSYHFCPTCGSTLFWYKEGENPILGIAVGNFVDPGLSTRHGGPRGDAPPLGVTCPWSCADQSTSDLNTECASRGDTAASRPPCGSGAGGPLGARPRCRSLPR